MIQILLSSSSAESQALGFVSIGSKRCYSSSLIPEIHVDTEGALPKAVQRGTGGRGSFNGHVVTVFGATGCLGHKLVPYLCSKGCQVIIPYRRDPLYSRELRPNGELGQILYMVRDWVHCLSMSVANNEIFLSEALLSTRS